MLKVHGLTQKPMQTPQEGKKWLLMVFHKCTILADAYRKQARQYIHAVGRGPHPAKLRTRAQEHMLDANTLAESMLIEYYPLAHEPHASSWMKVSFE